MTEEQENEIKRLTKMFHELPTVNMEDAKQCAMRSIKLQIEILQKVSDEKFIVHWSRDKFNQLIQDKYHLLTEIRKIEHHI